MRKRSIAALFLAGAATLGVYKYGPELIYGPQTETTDHDTGQMDQSWRAKDELARKVGFVDALVSHGNADRTIKTLSADNHPFFSAVLANVQGTQEAKDLSEGIQNFVTHVKTNIVSAGSWDSWNGRAASLTTTQQTQLTDEFFDVLNTHFGPGTIFGGIGSSISPVVSDIYSFSAPQERRQQVTQEQTQQQILQQADMSLLPERPGIFNAHASGAFATLGAVLAEMTTDTAKAARIKAQIDLFDENSIRFRAAAFTKKSFQQTGSNRINMQDTTAQALAQEAADILAEWKQIPEYTCALIHTRDVEGSISKSSAKQLLDGMSQDELTLMVIKNRPRDVSERQALDFWHSLTKDEQKKRIENLIMSQGIPQNRDIENWVNWIEKFGKSETVLTAYIKPTPASMCARP